MTSRGLAGAPFAELAGLEGDLTTVSVERAVQLFNLACDAGTRRRRFAACERWRLQRGYRFFLSIRLSREQALLALGEVFVALLGPVVLGTGVQTTSP